MQQHKQHDMRHSVHVYIYIYHIWKATNAARHCACEKTEYDYDEGGHEYDGDVMMITTATILVVSWR